METGVEIEEHRLIGRIEGGVLLRRLIRKIRNNEILKPFFSIGNSLEKSFIRGK